MSGLQRRTTSYQRRWKLDLSEATGKENPAVQVFIASGPEVLSRHRLLIHWRLEQPEKSHRPDEEVKPDKEATSSTVFMNKYQYLNVTAIKLQDTANLETSPLNTMDQPPEHISTDLK